MKPLQIFSTATRIAALALLLPAGTIAAQNLDSASITKLLQQVDWHAALADDDADTLVSYLHSDLHWRTHGQRLNQIRQHVNDLVEDGNQLTLIRAEGSPWQQEAIDHITPLLPVVATHLNATIEHFNDNLDRTRMLPFHDYVRTNSKLIHDAHEMISGYADYGESKAKMDALEQNLKSPNASGAGL